ncbi:hypothetical protein ACFYST_13510 [Kitasatospora sp. NPDC004614]|uniref:hypothetical protein n=1 Tax=unclassified Kitasatospora TaxID=2633591 RepID=UPI0036AA2FED
MTDPATGPVHVNYTRADGYLLEIEGTVENPFVMESDAITHTKSCAEDAVRKVLGILADEPVTLRITTDDDWLFARTDAVELADD